MSVKELARQAVESARSMVQVDHRDVGGFRVRRDQVFVLKRYKDETVEEPLANFIAEITEEVRYIDDSERIEIIYRIEGHCAGEALPQIDVPASRFGKMDWVAELWGSRPHIEPGPRCKDEMRSFIQQNSEASQRMIFRHTGWVRVGDKHVYLLPGRSISEDGEVIGVEVRLHEKFSGLRLPAHVSTSNLRHSIRTSLAFLDVGPDEVTLPLFSFLMHSMVERTPFTLYLHGKTGSMKTTIAKVLLAHFGEAVGDETLMSFNDTLNSLMDACHLLKDGLLVVDDYKPGVGAHASAAQLLQMQGDGSNKSRATRSGSLAAPKAMRCSILATGEDLPAGGASTQARLFAVHLPYRTLDLDRLSAVQAAARDGVLARVTADYLSWLVKNLDRVRGDWKSSRQKLASEYANPDVHPRSPTQASSLELSMATFMEFAVQSGAITPEEHTSYMHRTRAALMSCLEDQAYVQAEVEPLELVRSVTAEAIATGLARVSPPHLPSPMGNAVKLGWDKSPESDTIYIFPNEWLTFLRKHFMLLGHGMPPSDRVLARLLAERGVLTERESGRFKCRPSLPSGKRSHVALFAVSRRWLLGPEPEQG